MNFYFQGNDKMSVGLIHDVKPENDVKSERDDKCDIQMAELERKIKVEL